MWVLLFIATFIFMEWFAWFLHKYVMHGPLWILHEDHHTPRPDRKWQLNDFFAFFFAVPSFLFILFDHLYSMPHLGAVGYGIMAYGAAYFFVHEVLIHRRIKFMTGVNHWYFEALNRAHKIHHSKKTKEGTENFGMLWVPMNYFRASLKKFNRVRLNIKNQDRTLKLKKTR